MFECKHAPFALAPALAAELAAAYASPGRAYHDATHIADVLAWFDRVADDVGWRDAAAVYAAILFHDAIYVPGATDNEARSAAWVRASDVPCDRERAAHLIELTARHGQLQRDAFAGDPDAALFLDCDMAILGAAPAAFDAYDAAIAIEYQAVPADAYRAGRRAFLAAVLAAPRIYLSDHVHAQLDAPARANLARAIARY